jgi:hypothetical protein
MKHPAAAGISSVAAVLSMPLAHGDAMAGQFKTLETTALGPRQQISAFLSLAGEARLRGQPNAWR